jgi:uncharacterized protein YkwD
MLVMLLGMAANNLISQQHKSVLGYATDMSVQELLDDTNIQRADNGEPSLTINSDLNLAAQTKANNMSALDYWSHDTPDGQTPWSFMTAAGYNYQTAGENLAYGFDTASDVLSGWMNSADHRANILNTTYHDIGFGIVNIANYQNSGPETLVDAMYGSLAGEAVIAATPQPQVTKTVSSSPSTQSTPTAKTPTVTANPTTPTAQPVNTPVATTQPAATPTTSASQTPATTEPPQQQIIRIQLVADGSTNSAVLLVVVFGSAAFAFLLIRHGIAWRKSIGRGQRFVIRHPTLDIAASLVIIVCIILTRASGLIR